jgi:hypothetical protein
MILMTIMEIIITDCFSSANKPATTAAAIRMANIGFLNCLRRI